MNIFKLTYQCLMSRRDRIDIIEKELSSLVKVVNELVEERKRVEWFTKGALALYVIQYFGLKEFIAKAAATLLALG